MTLLNLTVVGLRCLGVFFIAQAFGKLAEVAAANSLLDQFDTDDLTKAAHGTLYQHHAHVKFFFRYLEFPVSLVTGGLFLAFARPIAVRITSGMNEKQEVDSSPVDVQGLAFLLTGVMILFGLLPKLGAALLDVVCWFFYSGPVDPKNSISVFGNWFANESALSGIGVFAQLFVGLSLVLRPKLMRRLWHWLRTAGTGPRNP
jgi:hypothetical protein